MCRRVRGSHQSQREGEPRPSFYVANRAHHADVGGAQPASMGLSQEIYQEGLRIPPVALARGGKIQRDVLAILLANVRTPREREGDLMAQVAACRLGERRLQELLQRYGAARTGFYLEALQSYSARLMKEALAKIPAGTYTAEDFLDNDGHEPGAGPFARGHQNWRGQSHGGLPGQLAPMRRMRERRLRHHLLGGVLCLPMFAG